MKITCKAEGVEYETTIAGYPETTYDIHLDPAGCTYTDVEPCTNYYTIEVNANGGTCGSDCYECEEKCSNCTCECEELTTGCSCRADKERECQAASADKAE